MFVSKTEEEQAVIKNRKRGVLGSLVQGTVKLARTTSSASGGEAVSHLADSSYGLLTHVAFSNAYKDAPPLYSRLRARVSLSQLDTKGIFSSPKVLPVKAPGLTELFRLRAKSCCWTLA